VSDWQAWHRGYDDPGSDLSARLRSVQRSLEAWLDERVGTPVRVVSACAGDGRDLLEVLARRPGRDRVSARLLESDPVLAGRAASFAAEHGLAGVEVRQDDAGRTDSYRGAVPADLVMLCGVLGNLTDEDARATVRAARRLCAPGAVVLWTRGHFPDRDPARPEPTEQLRGWFAEEGFAEVSWDAPRATGYRVGAHRLVAEPLALGPDHVFFRFDR
jgi:hypothetical protein